MVLERLFRRDETSLTSSFEDPNTHRDKSEYDCLSCRIVGSTALVSLGGYTYFSGMKGLRERRQLIELSKSRYKSGSRQLGILMLSGALVGVGLYRTVN
jgi:hypothetical protein